MPAGPLAGVRVLELGSMYAAPTCGRMLRDFGAEVIKVEDPTHGDYARQWTPMKNGQSLGFARLNSGKRSVGIDLRTDEGRALVRKLAAKVDVVIESFRPGRMASWGLGYDVLAADNPGLVLTSVSGFGQTGPYSEKPGFGTVAETGSGFAYVNGWPETPPTSPPFGFADSIAGISAAMGTAMALFRRERTGEGDHVDVALYEPLMFIVGDMILNYTGTGLVQGRVGNGTGSASPRGVYQAADGKWLSIAASNQGIAKRLFAAMGRPEMIDDPRYATNAVRMQHNDELPGHREAPGSPSGPAAEILEVLDKFEVVCSQVNDASDIVEDPHFLERTLVELTGSRGARRGAHPRSGPAREGLRRPGLRRRPVDRRAHRRGPHRGAGPRRRGHLRPCRRGSGPPRLDHPGRVVCLDVPGPVLRHDSRPPERAAGRQRRAHRRGAQTRASPTVARPCSSKRSSLRPSRGGTSMRSATEAFCWLHFTTSSSSSAISASLKSRRASARSVLVGRGRVEDHRVGQAEGDLGALVEVAGLVAVDLRGASPRRGRRRRRCGSSGRAGSRAPGRSAAHQLGERGVERTLPDDAAAKSATAKSIGVPYLGTDGSVGNGIRGASLMPGPPRPPGRAASSGRRPTPRC